MILQAIARWRVYHSGEGISNMTERPGDYNEYNATPKTEATLQTPRLKSASENIGLFLPFLCFDGLPLAGKVLQCCSKSQNWLQTRSVVQHDSRRKIFRRGNAKRSQDKCILPLIMKNWNFAQEPGPLLFLQILTEMPFETQRR